MLDLDDTSVHSTPSVRPHRQWFLALVGLVAVIVMIGIAALWGNTYNAGLEAGRLQGRQEGIDQGKAEGISAGFDHGVMVGQMYGLARKPDPPVATVQPVGRHKFLTQSGTPMYTCVNGEHDWLMGTANSAEISGAWFSTNLSGSVFHIAWNNAEAMILEIGFTDTNGKWQERHIPILAKDDQVLAENQALAKKLVTTEQNPGYPRSLSEIMMSMTHTVNVDLTKVLPDWDGDTRHSGSMYIHTKVCDYKPPAPAQLRDPGSVASQNLAKLYR